MQERSVTKIYTYGLGSRVYFSVAVSASVTLGGDWRWGELGEKQIPHSPGRD